MKSYDETKKNVIEQYKMGNKTPKQLSEEFKVPLPTLYVWLRQSNTKMSESDEIISEGMEEIQDNLRERSRIFNDEVEKRLYLEKKKLQEEIELYKNTIRNLNTLLEERDKTIRELLNK